MSRILQRLVDEPAFWYATVYKTPSYPWQTELSIAIEDIVERARKNLIPPVEGVVCVARQGGKNETGARTEARLLLKYSEIGGSIVKAAPTSKPQLHISKTRLREVMSNPVMKGKVSWEEGYICRLGAASLAFLSAEPSANRVGHTASLLLEVDEAQDVISEIYHKDFRPMCATTGAPTILFGTVWDFDTLLEQKRQAAREEQKRLGIRLLWEYDWQHIARHNESYREFVEREIELMGEDHPIIKTQYKLEPVAAAGRFISEQELEHMHSPQPRYYSPKPGRFYVAGVDLCGADEQDLKELALNPDASRKRDATVVTVAELKWKLVGNSSTKVPVLQVVDHLYIPGRHPMDAVNDLHRYIFEHWNCLYCVVDATGVGDSVAAMLESRRPDQVTALKSTAYVASRLGYNLLGAIKTGRFRLYKRDSTEESIQCWFQFQQCRRELRPNGHMRFAAPTARQVLPETGTKVDVHDDFVKSAAYCLEAAERHLVSHHDPQWTNAPDPMEWQDGAGFA